MSRWSPANYALGYADMGPFHNETFLVLVSGSRAEWLCAAVTEAIAIVRFPGELFIFLG